MSDEPGYRATHGGRRDRYSLIDRPSPNHEPRPSGVAIDTLILHYTGMTSAAAALDRLCDPTAEVSAHYMIDDDGTVYRLVPEDRRAWHAGVSYWAGSRNINDRSVGIELHNPGHEFGYRPFPESQMAALERLALEIVNRHPIPAARVLGHADVAPARKQDPGELFEWRRLAGRGIGLWPESYQDGDLDVRSVQRGLARFGYDVAATGERDAATRAAITAFQRHFRPARVDGNIDAETAGLLESLLSMID